MESILGIDQGGTKTYAAVMDFKGNILSCHKADGCYFPDSGINAAMRSVSTAAKNAMKSANVKMQDIKMIVAGVTGIDWVGDEALVLNALKKRFGSREIIACNDCEIAHYSGSLNHVGAVICGGTGINAALFAPGGEKFIMSDYLKCSLQGGSAIAAKAIEAVFESDLGVLPETKLTQLFLDFSGNRSAYELMQRYITSESFSREIISLVPQIIETADNGDQVAQVILERFANDLSACFIAAMKKMNMLDLDCDIVLAGSVFKGRVNGLTTLTAQKILQSAKNANIVNARFEPIVGACILGLLKKFGQLDEDTVRNIAVSAERLNLLRQLPESIYRNIKW